MSIQDLLWIAGIAVVVGAGFAIWAAVKVGADSERLAREGQAT